LSMPVVALAQKADGYSYNQNDRFSPGLYEAIVDAKVFSDIDRKAAYKGLLIRKGMRVRVYSAGYHAAQQPSMDWLGLGAECNGAILPWKDFGWVGALMVDFKRVGDLSGPMYEKGLITNCAASNPLPIQQALKRW